MKHSTKFLLMHLLLSVSLLQGYAQKRLKVDFKTIARELTVSANTEEEKAEAIYRFISGGAISYDLENNNNTAEECYTYGSGTDKGIIALYKKLCDEVGVKTIRVNCIAKGQSYANGKIYEEYPHTYLWVKGKGKGNILIVDPAKGVGSIKDGRFVREPQPMTWFNVEPEWMIFNNYPLDVAYQGLSNTLSKEEFLSLPKVNPALRFTGFSGKEVLEKFRTKQINSLPVYKYNAKYSLKTTSVPLAGTLEVGKGYTFMLKKSDKVKYLIIHNNNFLARWQDIGNEMSLSYVPTEPGELYIAQHDPTLDSSFPILVYSVGYSSSADSDFGSEYAHSDIQLIPGYSPQLEEVGFETQEILKGLRDGSITTLPMVYPVKPQVKVVSAPYNGRLKTGKEYDFVLDVPSDYDLGLSYKNKFYLNWRKLGGNNQGITITPDKTGKLSIHVAPQGTNKFSLLLDYFVENGGTTPATTKVAPTTPSYVSTPNTEPVRKEPQVVVEEPTMVSSHPLAQRNTSKTNERTVSSSQPVASTSSRPSTVTNERSLTNRELGVETFHNNDVFSQEKQPVSYGGRAIPIINKAFTEELACDSVHRFKVILTKGQKIMFSFDEHNQGKANNKNWKLNFNTRKGETEIEFQAKEEGALSISAVDSKSNKTVELVKSQVKKPISEEQKLMNSCLTFVKVHSDVVLATQSEGFRPKMYPIRIMKQVGDKLYFVTTAESTMYKDLSAKPYAEIMSMSGTTSVNISGSVSFAVSDELARSIYNDNPSLKNKVNNYKDLIYFSLTVESATYSQGF